MRSSVEVRWEHRVVESATSMAKRLFPERLLPLALDLYGTVNAIIYAGDNVTCPCCSGSFRKFKAYGAVKRLGVMCPRCRSFARHRLVWLYLEQRTAFFTDELVVLHFAPEFWLRRVFDALPNLRYVSADLRSPLSDLRTDITDIACADGLFDVVICVHVLEHVSKDRRAVSEILRVLKPGGWAIIVVPLDAGREETLEVPGADSPAERMRLYGKRDHVRIYGSDFGERLAGAGFEVTRERFGGQLGPEVMKTFGLSESTDIYLCVRPAGSGPLSGEAPA